MYYGCDFQRGTILAVFFSINTSISFLPS